MIQLQVIIILLKFYTGAANFESNEIRHFKIRNPSDTWNPIVSDSNFFVSVQHYNYYSTLTDGEICCSVFFALLF